MSDVEPFDSRTKKKNQKMKRTFCFENCGDGELKRGCCLVFLNFYHLLPRINFDGKCAKVSKACALAVHQLCVQLKWQVNISRILLHFYVTNLKLQPQSAGFAFQRQWDQCPSSTFFFRVAVACRTSMRRFFVTVGIFGLREAPRQSRRSLLSNTYVRSFLQPIYTTGT